ncbi:MAG TPA: hypothetical protein VE077_03085 [Candidatus Methylomirabilis sp.]|nr:hypothetical protein [Candidatus Methylomirabilis sp.]
MSQSTTEAASGSLRKPFGSRRSVLRLFAAALALILAALRPVPARADVGVLLNESLDSSLGRITGSGHSAVYFSRICADSPIKLRLCRPGEDGSVMSNYTTLGEDQPFEWNVVPLSIYLYGVEDPQNRPLFGTSKIKRLLEERYREKYLAGYCDGAVCRKSNSSEWREMVGATLERSIYVFILQTTVEQDEAFIERFNVAPNQNHFNGVTNNCATFSERVVNSYFPHAARADYLNDFFLTTPKAIARSFVHYGQRHPEAHLRVLHFAQLPGTIKRSTEARSGTEQFCRSKKLLVPMVIFADHELPFFAASYLLTGRFNPEHELEARPSPEASDMQQQLRQARSHDDTSLEAQLEAAIKQEDAEIVGTPQAWKQYHVAFDGLADEAVHREIIPSRDSLNRFFKFLDRAGKPTLDADGSLWLEIAQGGKLSRLGLSADNILASGTDSQWAYALTLARANYYLKTPKHSRETLPDFQDDWAFLQSARANSSAASITAQSASPVPVRTSAIPVGQK